MRFIDSHQHFWDLSGNRLPWLSEAPIAFRYGDYEVLKRNYLPDDYRRDARNVELAGAIYVESEWAHEDALREVDWVEALAAVEALPTAMVAQARLDREDAPNLIAALSERPIVRGVRHKPAVAASKGAVVRGAPGSMGDPAWRRGYALLAPAGLHFELQVPWWHLYEAAELAAEFPATRIILNHAGLPAARDSETLAGWSEAMRHLARQPNVAVKISGLGQKHGKWTIDANRFVVQETIAAFGVDRCMFGSNFPVDGLVGSFETIIGGYETIMADSSASVRAALFHDNASRFYRLGTG